VADNQERAKVRIGTVSSDKMTKTITVSVETVKQHPLYKKTIKTSKKYKAHDENNDAKIGDVVKIMETRPLSKDKRWKLVEIIRKAKTLQ
jgi:small subunit ribosomal protein S17